MKLIALVLVALLFLSGCSSRKPTPHKVTLKKYKKSPRKETVPYKLRNKNAITVSLYEEYKKWYGTPYKYGGTSMRGIDCSAFVQTVFMDAFRVRVPRTTKEQVKRGYQVSRKKIRAGDIVFFRTSWNSRHSGIYLEKGNFMHTSSKHGVTISSLNNPYWRSKYWQTRRVLP